VLDVAQVAGAVQAVQAGDDEFGEVADVVQPGGGLEQVGIGA
jgi:allantoicase